MGTCKQAVVIFAMIFCCLGELAKSAESKQFTRDLLMKSGTIPVRREFPLSTKVSPCEDFHKYVCESVEASFQLPADRSAWDFSFTDSDERLLQAKQKYFQMLEQGYSPSTERAKQFKDVYLACMNTTEQKKDEIRFVKKEMKEVAKIKSRDDLLKFLSERIGTAEYTFVDVGGVANQADPFVRDLLVITSLMSLPEKSYYANEELMKELHSLAESFFKTLGLDGGPSRAKGLLEFEKQFAETFPVPAEFRTRYTANTYEEKSSLLANFGNLRLKQLFEKIPAEAKVRNIAKEALQFVNQKLADADIEMLKNFILFHSLKDMMDVAYPEFYQKGFNFRHKFLGGPEVRPPLQERCTKLVMRNFGMELDNELLPILFPGFPEDRVVQMVGKVRQSILAGIKANTWLTEEARKEALKKMETAALHLVKPKIDEDWDFLPIQKYNPKAAIANLMKIHQTQMDKMFRELHEKRNRNRWSNSPLTVNAYYSPSDNKFVLLQGILQYPFFDGGQSEIENLGAMGTVIGHELGHGIDDQGAKYDATGAIHQWMTAKDIEEFGKRGQKFIDRFEKIGHVGKLTLGENIGDHVGLTFSFRTAFDSIEKANAEDLKKFFVAYARLWCAVERPEYEKMIIKTNPHALPWARINEQVIHQDGFYKAFACKKGDKMFVDPSERIRIW